MRVFKPFISAAVILVASLSTAAAAAVAGISVPRTLRQATRAEVVQRLNLPDGTWTARKARRSAPTSMTCGEQAGGGTCGCDYVDWCNSQVVDGDSLGVPLTRASFAACVVTCDTTIDCNSVTYRTSTSICLMYTDSAPTFVTNTDYMAAVYDPVPFCGGECYPPPSS